MSDPHTGAPDGAVPMSGIDPYPPATPRPTPRPTGGAIAAPIRPRGPVLDMDPVDPAKTPAAVMETTSAAVRAALVRTTAGAIDDLSEAERESLLDKLVRLSPLPDFLDRLILRMAVDKLSAALRALAAEIAEDAIH